MPAAPADIQRAIRPSKVVLREDPAILAQHSNARDQKNDPTPGYFESSSDAELALAEIANLIGVRRRRFLVTVDEILSIDPLNGIPTYRLVDAENGVDADALVTSMEVDFEANQTRLEVLV